MEEAGSGLGVAMPSTGKRFAAAVIALAAWAGLGVQLHATHALLGALPEALWAMARYRNLKQGNAPATQFGM